MKTSDNQKEKCYLAETIYVGTLVGNKGYYLFHKTTDSQVEGMMGLGILYTIGTDKGCVRLKFALNEYMENQGCEFLARPSYDYDEIYALTAAVNAYEQLPKAKQHQMKELFADEDDLSTLATAFKNCNKITTEQEEQMEKAIKVATEWWANDIRKPNFDNGDSQSGAMVSLVSELVNASSSVITAEALSEFQKHLGNEIKKGLLTGSDWTFDIGVDYHPDDALAKSAQKAGLRTMFSYKTNMNVGLNEVSVRAGYQAPHVTLYDGKTQDKSSNTQPKNTSTKKL